MAAFVEQIGSELGMRHFDEYIAEVDSFKSINSLTFTNPIFTTLSLDTNVASYRFGEYFKLS